jgi:hypothetical protein
MDLDVRLNTKVTMDGGEEQLVYDVLPLTLSSPYTRTFSLGGKVRI